MNASMTCFVIVSYNLVDSILQGVDLVSLLISILLYTLFAPAMILSISYAIHNAQLAVSAGTARAAAKTAHELAAPKVCSVML